MTARHALTRSRKVPLRGAAVGAVAIAVAALMVADGGSDAAFTANSNTPGNIFKTASLAAPSGLTAARAGQNVNVSWTGVAGAQSYVLSGGPGSTTGACTSVSWQVLATVSTSSYSDVGRSESATGWYCYTVANLSHGWTSVNNPVKAVQLPIPALCSGVTWSTTGAYPKNTVVAWKGHNWKASYWADEGLEPGVAPNGSPWLDQGTCAGDPTPPACTAPIWSSTTTYHDGDMVTWKSHMWQARWYSVNTDPSTIVGFGPWEDLGACTAS